MWKCFLPWNPCLVLSPHPTTVSPCNGARNEFSRREAQLLFDKRERPNRRRKNSESFSLSSWRSVARFPLQSICKHWMTERSVRTHGNVRRGTIRQQARVVNLNKFVKSTVCTTIRSNNRDCIYPSHCKSRKRTLPARCHCRQVEGVVLCAPCVFAEHVLPHLPSEQTEEGRGVKLSYSAAHCHTFGANQGSCTYAM